MGGALYSSMIRSQSSQSFRDPVPLARELCKCFSGFSSPCRWDRVARMSSHLVFSFPQIGRVEVTGVHSYFPQVS